MKTHYHGINLSLSSIRNQRSSGIGEYLDLIPLIEWVHDIGFDIIQLLPLNDSGGDSSPYSALTAQGLHPINISLWALPFLEYMPEAEEQLSLMRHCNSSKRFRYHDILKKKISFLRDYFESAFPHIQKMASFQEFTKSNPWLQEYALFKILKAEHQEVAWWDWQTVYQAPTPALFSHLTTHFQKEVQFHEMVQFFAFDQMKQVKRIASQSKVLIKGDIPILINRDSADVWAHQESFVLDLAAGAPPDMYSQEGQYWGFPLYNWEIHERSDFSWWKERLRVAQELYDIYRIDHIVGFFRIWAIPLGKPAKEGFFLPADEKEWIPQGRKILKMMIDSSTMTPIGEDLGVVPDDVRACMKELGIAGTKVMRWERRWHEDRSYILLNQYPEESMTTLSTHDSETFVAWWQHAEEDALRFASDYNIPFESPLLFSTHVTILKLAHQTHSRYHINLLQEYLALFPELSWEDPDDERINIPGIVNESNWTYRFMPMLNTIIAHEGLKAIMRQLRFP